MIRTNLRMIRKMAFLVRYFRNWRELAFLIAKGKRPTKINLRNGIVIEAPPNNTLLEMTKEMFIANVYTPPDLTIEANDVVVDIGANIGFFALYAAGKTQNTIYTFEPFPENVEFLKKNINANDCRNIVIDCLAVSDKSGIGKLYLSEICGGHLMFDHNINGKLHDYIEVPTKTLEEIMRDHSIEKIDFLKLDCEGSEGQILKSASSSCLGKIMKIAMEFHDNVSLLKHDEIKKLLEDHGFSCNLDWDGKSQFGYLYSRRH